jgi:hypothetical protein
MKHRDPQLNLMSSMGHLRCDQPNSPSDPFNVLLPTKGWQYQVPYPERQVIAQLGTQKIHPVAHESLQRKMKQKLIRELGNPPLRHPSLVVKLQNLFDFTLTICHHYIIRIAQYLKERFLSGLGCLLLSPNQVSIGTRPSDRLIPKLSIAQRIILGIALPRRLRQRLSLPHQGACLIRCNRKAPSLLFAKSYHLLPIKRRITSEMHPCPPQFFMDLKLGGGRVEYEREADVVQRPSKLFSVKER